MNYAGTLCRFATGVALGFGGVVTLWVLLKDKTRDLPDSFATDWTSTADTAYDNFGTTPPVSWATNALPNIAQETASWQATAEILAEGPKRLRSILRARRHPPRRAAPPS